jgi:alkanesulfonate monooxygenase SsuD/methylene tetrahydromethanopterin reductase-like flavin-dependent oxidoreductase (luciferase family)
VASSRTEHGFLTSSYYAKLGRTLEEGCFDMMFFDDRLAMPGIYGGSVAEAVRYGARPVKMDLSIVLGVIAGVTDRSGLARRTRPPTTRRSTSPVPSQRWITSPVVERRGTWSPP